MPEGAVGTLPEIPVTFPTPESIIESPDFSPKQQEQIKGLGTAMEQGKLDPNNVFSTMESFAQSPAAGLTSQQDQRSAMDAINFLKKEAMKPVAQRDMRGIGERSGKIRHLLKTVGMAFMAILGLGLFKAVSGGGH